MRRIVKDVTGLFFHACLPSIPEVNDNPFRFTFTLDIDTNVADLITEVLHELHYAENKHTYKFIDYWKNKLNELLMELPIRHDDRFVAFCNLIDVRYITWEPIPSEDSPITFGSRVILINDTTIDFRKVFTLQQNMYKAGLGSSSDQKLPAYNQYFICYERCNSFLKSLDEDTSGGLYYRLLKFRK